MTGPRNPRELLETSVTSGREPQPLRAILYGPDGVGTTTLASGASKPVFVVLNEGASALDVVRLRPSNLNTLIEFLTALADRSAHDYDTVVLDGLDDLQRLIEGVVAREANASSFEEVGFKRDGLVKAAVVQRVRPALKALGRSGVDVVLLAKATLAVVKTADQRQFHTSDLRIPASMADPLKEWANLIGYMDIPEATAARLRGREEEDEVDAAARVLHTVRSTAWVAKNSFTLPPEIRLPERGSWLMLAHHLGESAAYHLTVRPPGAPRETRTTALETEEVGEPGGDADGDDPPADDDPTCADCGHGQDWHKAGLTGGGRCTHVKRWGGFDKPCPCNAFVRPRAPRIPVEQSPDDDQRNQDDARRELDEADDPAHEHD